MGTFRTDVVSISPGISPGPRTISGDVDGSLLLSDPIVGALTLSRLASLSAAVRTYTVAPSGAKYSTIQSAIDDVPAQAYSLNPERHLILIAQGDYPESLVVEKEGITLLAVGRARILGPGPSPALRVRPGLTTRPLAFRAVGLEFTCASATLPSVVVEGLSYSDVGLLDLLFDGCSIASSTFGVGASFTRVVQADLQGCVLGVVSTSQVGLTRFWGCRSVGSVFGVYDSGQPLPDPHPDGGGLRLHLLGCGSVDSVVATVDASFSVRVEGTPRPGSIAVTGPAALVVRESQPSSVTVSATSSVVVSCPNTPVLSSDGSAIDRPRILGVEGFNAASSAVVPLDPPLPDADYIVLVEPVFSDLPQVSVKTASSFTLTYPSPVTGDVGWSVLRSSI